MLRQPAPKSLPHLRISAVALCVAAGLLAGGCSSGSALSPLDGLLGAAPEPSANPQQAAAATPLAGKSDLEKATEYWGDQYKQKPHDLKAALAYARNLKAAGHKEQAFAVVQNAAVLHGDSKDLASEYGRLALELGQVAVAEKVLALADDPMKPDWRVVSARGTVLAKQGKYAEAVPFYQRALAISPNQPSVLNNLAMAHAAAGEPQKAEQLLREAAKPGGNPQINRNLALVVGLQGKHDEAKLISASLPADSTSADLDYIKRMVKAPPQPAQAVPAVVKAPEPKAAPRSGARVIEAKAKAAPAAPANGLRPAAAPGDVPGLTGAWSLNVSKTGN